LLDGEFAKKRNIGIYHPLSGEPNLLPLHGDHNMMRNFSLPKVLPWGDHAMEFSPFNKKDFDKLIKGPCGSLEVDTKSCVIPDVIFVPGMAFDKSGNRLG